MDKKLSSIEDPNSIKNILSRMPMKEKETYKTRLSKAFIIRRLNLAK